MTATSRPWGIASASWLFLFFLSLLLPPRPASAEPLAAPVTAAPAVQSAVVQDHSNTPSTGDGSATFVNQGSPPGTEHETPSADNQDSVPYTASPIPAAELAALIGKAHELKLQDSRKWLSLLHYRDPFFGGRGSVIDDPRFFLSPTGKTDAGAELEATIRGFFRTDIPASKLDEHPICRFPARLYWLRRVLGIDQWQLPAVSCVEQDKFMRVLNPKSAALVFPESHINSPASMFGHTLIRLDSAYESRLLSYSISYSAVTPEAFDFMYAMRGIFGGYYGYFSTLPYYEKINDYTHMESRDLWEYDLNLTEKEVYILALHVWELKDIYSDYYFFDENCAYILLFLIESARPEVHLSDQFFYWVTPVDTLRVIEDSGLIANTVFRPSKATRIAYIESIAPGNVRKAAARIALGEQAPESLMRDDSIAEADKIKALDLATEYTQKLSTGNKMDKKVYSGRYLDILRARSTLSKLDYDIPVPVSPEKGHATSRLALGGGQMEEADYSLLRWRFAYHGIMDMDAGYKPGAAITFLDAELRHYTEADKTVLERLMLVDIVSIAPRGAFLKPVSWKVRGGVEREIMGDGTSRTPAVLKGAGGVSYGIGRHGFAFAMLEPALKAGGGLEKHYALGGGASAGVLFELAGMYKIMVEGRAVYYSYGDTHASRSASLRQTFGLSTNNTLSLDMTRRLLDGYYSSDINMVWNIYF